MTAHHPAKLRRPRRPDAELLNRALRRHLETYPHQTPELLEAALYSVESPGHRWRPVLLFRAHAALDADADYREMLTPACAIEYLHTASIILDDLPAMDDGTLRRGRPPCHLKFSQSRAILAAHWLCHIAQHLLHEFQLCRRPSADLEDSFRRLMNDMMRGQVCDLEGRILTQEQIIEKYRLKSGCLYGFTASLPAHALSRSDAAQHLERFGHYLGIAYQISDDIHDHTDAAEVLGKDVRKDVGKSTIPTLCGLAKAVEMQNSYKERALGELRHIPGMIEEVGGLVEQICL